MNEAPPPRTDRVVLDACCLINLFATGRPREILAALPVRWSVSRYVAEEEVLEIAREDEPAAGTRDRGRVALHPLLAELISQGIIELLDVTSEEEQGQLVRFAAQLDDGEAHTCALAIVRGARVATDDRKAIRVLRAAWQPLDRGSQPELRTSEILFSWAQASSIDRAELVHVVGAIARRASFFPPRDDPGFDRWMELLGAGY